ncbi:MAG: hypothetical protein ACYCW6_27445, partial [Candidatus Xenobia bacterium]
MRWRRVLLVLVLILILGAGLALLFRSRLVSAGIQVWARATLNGKLRYQNLRVGLHDLDLQNVDLVQSNGSIPLRAQEVRISFDPWRADRPFSALTNVVLIRPSIDLIRLPNGTFNLPGFVKPSTVPGPPLLVQFGGLLQVVDGTLAYHDANFATTFTQLKGWIDGRQGPLLSRFTG